MAALPVLHADTGGIEDKKHTHRCTLQIEHVPCEEPVAVEPESEWDLLSAPDGEECLGEDLHGAAQPPVRTHTHTHTNIYTHTHVYAYCQK